MLSRFSHRFAALALAALAASGMQALAAAPAAPVSPTATEAYTVKPGDVLSISVWKEPDLQGPVLVRPDGSFSFPLAGQMDARGKTVADLQTLVTEKLRKYISDPVVTVSVQEVKGNKVYVLGQVNKPGEFIVNPRVDVMQALSMAGGTTPFAALGDIVILRRSDSGQQALPFRYADVSRGRNLQQNIVLQAGDVVVVP
ncbi:MAG TPA: polysaccharide biosynthesis/export family protein [Steroidobacteraceae bacterium]|jgi:polysaccharide export outer membrane protein